MKKDMYETIKPEKEKDFPIKEKSKKTVKVAKIKVPKVKEEKRKKEKNAVTVKKEGALKTFAKSIGKDAIIVFSIILAMVLVCLGVIFYYFFNITNANMATYKGGKVTRQEYEVQYRLMSENMKSSGTTAVDIRKDLVDNIVVNKMLVEKFDKEKIKLSDANNKLIADFKADKTTMATYTAKGITEKQLMDLYTQITKAQQYSEKIQAEVSDANLQKAIIAKDGEKANMNSYATRHILYTFSDSTTGEVKDKVAQKAKADAMLIKIKNGEDFATLAKANSEDTGSSADGGKVEMVADTNMGAPEYIAAMLTLKPGQVYQQVVETSYGYHIIKLESVTAGGRIQSTDVRDSYAYLIIMDMLKNANIKLNTKVIEKVEKNIVIVVKATTAE